MYDTPDKEIFNEMKQIAIDIWNTYDNKFGYVDEKLNRINSLDNVGDNAMIFYRMFDNINQTKFISKLNNKNIITYINNNL